MLVKECLSSTSYVPAPGIRPFLSASWKMDKKTTQEDQYGHQRPGNKEDGHPNQSAAVEETQWRLPRGNDLYTEFLMKNKIPLGEEGVERRGEKTPENKRHLLVVLQG